MITFLVLQNQFLLKLILMPTLYVNDEIFLNVRVDLDMSAHF